MFISQTFCLREVRNMKKKIIGIFVCMLLIITVFPVTGVSQVNYKMEKQEINLVKFHAEKTGKQSDNEYTIIDLGTLGGSNPPDIFWEVEGHTRSVYGVAFSHDGLTVASGAYDPDNTAKLWQADDGTLLHTYPDNDDGILSVDISSNNEFLAAGYIVNGYPPGGKMNLWDISEETVVNDFGGCLVSFSPDSEFIASGGGGANRYLYVHRVSNGEEIWGGYTGSYLSDVKFSPDGQIVASSGTDNKIKLWDAQTGNLIRTLSGHTNDVSCIAFSSDSEMIASGTGGYDASEESNIKIWKVSDGSLIRTLEGHGEWVYDVEFVPGGEYLVSSGREDKSPLQQKIKFWNVSSGDLYLYYDEQALDIAYSPLGVLFVYGRSDGYVVVANSPILPEYSAPKKPSDPMPSDGAIDVELNLTLSVKVTDPNMDSMTVRFYDASDGSLIGTDYGVASGDMAFEFWYNLSPETEYSWYTVADDGEYTNQSDTWSFTTCCANMPPDEPINPMPVDGATGVGLNPILSVEVTDPDGDFMTVSFFDASDDSLIGTDDDVISGNRAYVIWSDLSPSVTYSWYTIAEDVEYSTQSDTWSFTTDSVNNAPLEPTDPSPVDDATGVGLNPTLSVEVNDPDSDVMTVRFYDASDDSLIGTDDDVLSGGRAYTPWNGLSPSTTYDWYSETDDGEYITQSDTWSFTTGKDNNVPFEPINPIPKDDATGVGLNPILSVEVNDPDSDSMNVYFYDASVDSLIGTSFGIPSGSSAYIEWSNLDPLSMYSWYTIADDGEFTTQSDTWSFITMPDPDNNPPNAPTITGKTSGKPGIEYTYTFNSVDPDGDVLVYCIQWGDDSKEICIGPYSSGEDVTASHIFEEKGSYTIRAKAEDSNEAESDWGELEVTMPRNKPFNYNLNLLSRLFERFPNAFPLLRYILGLQ